LKKIIALMLVVLLTGCSMSAQKTFVNGDITGNTGADSVSAGDSASARDDDNGGVNDSPVLIQEDEFNHESDAAAGGSSWDASVSIDSITGKWYAGAIGDVRIHAKFDVSDNKVTGTYYYDKYKTEIPLQGYIDDEIRGMILLRMTEDTDKNGSVYVLFRTDDYAQGFWKSGETIYPMYLIREGSDAETPKPAGDEALAYKGLWYGSRSYYSGGEVIFTPLFSDFVFYDMSAHNGANSGWIESFGILENGSVKTVFSDTTYDSNENVFFSFKLKGTTLELDSNMYDYMCGAGVAFSDKYTREEPYVPVPTARDAGIVDTEEMAEVFREITGDDFETFISYTQTVHYEDIILDGKPAKAGKSYLRGMPGMCFYIVAESNIYAAYTDYDCIRYYTNDSRYASELPEPMREWASVQGIDVKYNYRAAE